MDPSSRLQIQGITSVLGSVKIVPSHEELLSLGREFTESGASVVPVHLNSAYWSDRRGDVEELFVTVSSGMTSQSVRVPVTVHFSAEGACAAAAGAGELGWASLFYFLLAHYQAVIFLILSCLACVTITKYCIGKGGGMGGRTAPETSMKPIKGPLAMSGAVSPVAQVISMALVLVMALACLMSPVPILQVGSPLNLSNAENKPYLWTVDNSPIYGSPDIRQRRAGASPRSLTQYSYTDM